LERADVPLLKTVIDVLLKHRQHSSALMSLYCANLACAPRLGFHTRLAEALVLAITHGHPQRDARLINELKWQFVALFSKDRVCKSLKPLLAALGAANDEFLEGVMVERALQFPLPGFSISQWSSFGRKDTTTKPTNEIMMIVSRNALLSFERSPFNNHSSILWSRTVVGRHSFLVDKLSGIPTAETAAQSWLDSLVEQKQQKSTLSQRESFSSDTNSVETTDPFVDELLSKSINRPSSPISATASLSNPDIGDMLQVVRQSQRKPTGLNSVSYLKCL
jgi:hypothetical protein